MTASDWIAIYGAVVSTGVALWTFWISRPKLRVDWIFALDPQRGAGFWLLCDSAEPLGARRPHPGHFAHVRVP